MKRTFTLISLSLALASAFAQAPAGYYDTLEGKSKGDLKKAAKNIVKNHKVISYGDDTWSAFRQTDTRIVNGKEIWWDMYSNNEVLVSSGHGGMNIEHSVANSWWGKTKNDAYKDLMHLNPSDAEANNRKANYPLGEVATVTWTNGITIVGHPKSGDCGGANYVYEPTDCYKGDFARVFMYMFTVYDDISWKDNTDWMYSAGSELTFKPWAYQLLLKWNKEDPVDQKEIDRNNAIYKIQGNRNPFIDCPELCEYIWGSKNNTPYHADGSGNSEDPNKPGDDPNKPGDDPINPGGEDPDPATGKTLLYVDFEQSAISYYENEGWGNYSISGNLDGWFLKEFSGNTYASASSYKETGSGPFEYWLVTPALELANAKGTLTFRTQGAYGVSGSELDVFAMDSPEPSAAYLTPLNAKICTPQPNGAKPVYSDWVESGSVALPSSDREIWIGFRYKSASGGSAGSATFCLDDVKVTATSDDSGFKNFDSEKSHFKAIGLQNAISIETPDGETVTIYDMAGRMVAKTGRSVISLPKGIYIATHKDSRVKVLVR